MKYIFVIIDCVDPLHFITILMNVKATFYRSIFKRELCLVRKLESIQITTAINLEPHDKIDILKWQRMTENEEYT